MRCSQAFSQWRLNWPVDSRYEYHATSMHWVLSEIILPARRRRLQDLHPRAHHRPDGARRAVHRLPAASSSIASPTSAT